MLDWGQLFTLGVVAVLGYAIYQRQAHDPREPPVVASQIPLIGHLIGVLWHGVAYFGLQAQKHPAYPIFSLYMLNSKVYVITSPALMLSAQRNNKAISFDPILTAAAQRVTGARGKTLHLLRDKQSGGHGLNATIIHAMQPALLGNGLDRMNERMIRLLLPFVDELEHTSTVDLHMWCRHAVTMASTDATYGPLNPYKDPAIENAFWDYETNISPLLANTLPSLTARKAWKGRETVISAIIKYFKHKGQEDGSELTYVRWKTTLDGGVPEEDVARLEASMGVALLSNTVPATFWVLFELYSRKELLEEIRQEVQQNAMHVDSDGTHIIDLAVIRDNCPLLVSTFQEILRTRSSASPTRYVTQDVLLGDQYLLKAGSIVNMPAASMGRNPEVWGCTSADFDPRRYMKPEQQSEEKKKDPRRAGGFMTFGVSPVICPGRHFASGEILGLAAMMILRVDLVPVRGVWKAPRLNSMAITSIMGPLKDRFDVHVKAREEFEGTRWDFVVKEGKGKFNLAVG